MSRYGGGKPYKFPRVICACGADVDRPDPDSITVAGIGGIGSWGIGKSGHGKTTTVLSKVSKKN